MKIDEWVKMKVGLVFNYVNEEKLRGKPVDAIAELDTPEITAAEKAALESRGHEVVLIEADENFSENLKKAKPDIIFNVSEGIGGESRESYVPNICETLGVPYTGSGPLALSLALDKAKTKEILTHYGIPTAKWQVFKSKDDRIDPSLRFPLIVKLLHEGSSMGLDEYSVVENEKDLRKMVERAISTYKEPALVEEFLDGREFTIAIIGNYLDGKEPMVFPIRETVHEREKSIVLYDPDRESIPLIAKFNPKEEVDKYLDEKRYSFHSECPAKITKDTEKEIKMIALEVFRAIGVRDWCRMEMRCRDGVPHVLELNPIAGIAPGYWFPTTAEVAGYDYNAFINLILDTALERLGMKKKDGRKNGAKLASRISEKKRKA